MKDSLTHCLKKGPRLFDVCLLPTHKKQELSLFSRSF